MVITDGILLELTRKSGLPYEYLESLARGGYFEDVEEENLMRHMALIEMSYENNIGM